MDHVEEEIEAGRLPFPQAQERFAAPALRRVPDHVDVGWYDESVDPEVGSFCVASLAEHEDLIGELLRISRGTREVFVYCLGQRDVPTPLAVNRRAFLALGLLTESSLSCVVEVLA